MSNFRLWPGQHPGAGEVGYLLRERTQRQEKQNGCGVDGNSHVPVRRETACRPLLSWVGQALPLRVLRGQSEKKPLTLLAPDDESAGP